MKTLQNQPKNSGFSLSALLHSSLLNSSTRRWLGGLVGCAAAIGVVGGVAGMVNAAPQPARHSAAAARTAGLPDGVYLYGQSEKPDQLGQGYFVFEVKKGGVVGALYMPRSSFDCASGQFQSDQLALTVVNSYDRTTNPFEIAVERTATVAAGGNPAFQIVGLQGFRQLDKISQNDYRMLNTCKADLQQKTKTPATR